MADKRIYKVVSNVTPVPGVKLIRATSQASVRAHLTRMFSIEIAEPEDIVELYGKGEKVEDAQGE